MDIEILKHRARIVSSIRHFFDSREFIEVDTPVWIAAPAPEEHIDCPALANGGFLRASPELQMKKLIAAGMPRIYQLGPCFREGEEGSRHHPEFTMLEWYRQGESYLAIQRDLEELLAALMGETIECKAISVREAYQRFAAWDPWTDWNQDRFDFDMATKIEPALKADGGGVFLMDYPITAASLARVVGTGSNAYAERWEFYWNGMELANCFTELCDGAEQRRRFEQSKIARQRLHEADYPLDEEFLASVPLMGSAAGVALGVDRLVMVLTGATQIGQVRMFR